MIDFSANHYLAMIDPRIAPHVTHCKVAFMGNHFLWASFHVSVKSEKDGVRVHVGELVYYAPDKIEARIDKYDNGAHYIFRTTQERMIEAMEAIK